MELKELGLWFASIREEKGFKSQRQLALASGVSPTTISRLEAGTQKPEPETLQKLAKTLNIEPEELLLMAGFGNPVTCPDCGVNYITPIEDKYHEEIHKKYLKAKERFGFFYPRKKNEEIKDGAYKILNNPNSTYEAKAKVADNLLKAYFSRELAVHSFETDYNFFEEFCIADLKKEKEFWLEKFTKEQYDSLLEYYKNKLKQKRQANLNIINITDIVKIPVLGVIRAGEPILAEENIIGYESISADEIKSGEYFYLKVKGDSMINARIYDGDLVLVRKQEDVENGQIAVILIEDEATLKRVYRNNGTLILHPENPKYQPMLIEKGNVKIIGKVVEVKFKL
ncbi:MAG: repressor LexA [Clostridia bacterium]|nr:repressor LexA [Clostridia bacterium]